MSLNRKRLMGLINYIVDGKGLIIMSHLIKVKDELII